MNRSLLLPAFFLATLGCDKVEDLKEDVEGATSRFVVQGVYLGVDEPDNELVAAALENTDFGSGATLTVFLADAADANEIEEAPISGVSLSLLSDANGGSTTLPEGSTGEYGLTGDEGLVYEPLETVGINTDFEGSPRTLSIQTPEKPSTSIDTTHTAGQPLGVSLQGQGFDAMLVVALDTNSGELVFSNEPQDLKEVYDMTRGSSDDLTLEIPGSALSEETIYAVGVAGLVNADSDDYDGVNTVLSTFLAGRFVFSAVCTLPEAALCE